MRVNVTPIPSSQQVHNKSGSNASTVGDLSGTETLPAREVFHEIQAAIRPLMSHIQTREQVSDFIQNLDSFQYRDSVHDPPIINHKGRPRTVRLTGALEGRPVGGGARSKKRHRENEENDSDSGPPRKKGSCRCGICHQNGHNRATCPLVLSGAAAP
ncbi:hypothetical protein C8J57DRAFT_1073960 [Mycena rebaudengoi]|nr:hypothetical protein C8J57DRAFT_1073960 [Mycena rebaudengoi]